jgi:hypothetical protein
MLRVLDRLEEILISSLMAAATLLIFVAVVHRYGTGVPVLYPILHQIHISWAQELCIYMFVWMAKFGAAYGVRTGIHVGVDVLINRLPGATRKAYVLFGLLSGATFTAGAAQDRDLLQPVLRRPVHLRHRHDGRQVRIRADGHRPGVARPRNAALDRVPVRADRLLPDVLPLPAGRLDVLAQRRAAAS